MKTTFLLPATFKKWGWVLAIPSLTLGILVMLGLWEPELNEIPWFAVVQNNIFSETVYFGMIETNIYGELLGIIALVGLIFIGFSKRKEEDEYTHLLRLEALSWATYTSYFVLITATLTVFGMAYLTVMVVNMFIPLIVFIARFEYLIRRR
jgi:hypothetical protein